MQLFGLFIVLVTQVLLISCQGNPIWGQNHHPDHHYVESNDYRDPEDEFVMVIEYDNCPTHEYVTRKATVTKVPLNELHHSHRRSAGTNGNSNVNTNVNSNQFRRSLDENSNVNVNTNSARRSLDDNSNVNTNVNTNSVRRSLDDNSNSNVNTNVNSNGGDASISVKDNDVNIQARRSQHANEARRHENHSPNANSRRNHGNSYGHRRNSNMQGRRNVVVSHKGSEIAVLDAEDGQNGVDVIVDHNHDTSDI